MSSKAITLNQTWNYSCIIPANSHEVKKSLKEAVLVSENTNCLRARFAATAYGIKALALSFFNAFAYFFLGVYHFTKEIFHCSCKEAFKLLGSNLADSIKSLCTALLGVAVVAVGFFFPHKIYSCFAEENKVLPSSTLEKTSSKKEKSATSVNQKTEELPDSKEKKKEEDLVLKHELINQGEKNAHRSFEPVIEDRLSINPGAKKDPALPIVHDPKKRFSGLPTELITLIDSFLDQKSKNSFAAVSKDLGLQARQRIFTMWLSDSFPWDKVTCPEILFHSWKTMTHVSTINFVDSNTIPKDFFSHLASAIKKGLFPQLRHLSFDHFDKNLSEDQLELLPLLEACPNLESFSARGTANADILEALSTYCRSLRFLNLRPFTSITPKQLEVALKNFPQLKRLNTSSTFTDEHLAVVSKFCSRFEWLNFLQSETLTEKGFSAFAKNKNFLKRLWLLGSGEKLTATAFRDLCKNSPFLEELFFTAKDKSNDHFNISLLPPTLKTLSVWSTFSNGILTDADIEKIPFLPELKHLSIHQKSEDTYITDATILKLAEKCPNLRYLSLSLLDISKNALIKWISKYPDLEYLDLSCMFLSDEILKVIAVKFPKLRFLRLSHSREITKQGLTHLQACKNLRYLNLVKTKFSDQFVPTKENVISLFPQLNLLQLIEAEDNHFPDSALIERGFPHYIG